MQDRYLSLDPSFATQTQVVLDRQATWQKRYVEATGGPLAEGVGLIAALTASTLVYSSRQAHGFTGFFPLCRRNAAHYTLIFGAGFLAYHFSSGMISSVTGDVSQQNYLARNKYAIISGELPFDRPEQQ